MDLDTLRSACLALPAAMEEIKWEHNLVFSVAGKMFCITHMEPDAPFSCKVADDRFEELLLVPGIVPAPYLARARWVQVSPGCVWKAGQKLDLMRESYQLICAKLSRKIRSELGLSSP